MYIKNILTSFAILSVLLLAPVAPQALAAFGDTPAQITLPETESAGNLRVFVGRSLVVQSLVTLKRVSVTDPAIASAVVVSPSQVMIHGLKPGTVSLLLWDPEENLYNFELQIMIDTKAFEAQLAELFPNEKITTRQSGNALVLSGEVSSQTVIDQAVELGKTRASAVVNAMWIKPPSTATIMLKVRFAEVDRAATQELGVNFLTTGLNHTIGSVGTQQFGNMSLDDTGSGGGASSATDVFELSDLLNVFIFRQDVNAGVLLRALQQKNLLQILAEPNLMATNGKEASFLAGGEFPFPTVQSGTGSTSISISFREFGIKLKFLANVLDNGRIRLKVAPEVSALDYANALTVSGFLIPALTSRKAETELELQDGQSFAIAGLLDNRTTENFNKIPGLGDIPILGKLFQSQSKNKNQTELMVMVTPVVVRSPAPAPTTPKFPESFLDTNNFDKNYDNHKAAAPGQPNQDK